VTSQTRNFEKDRSSGRRGVTLTRAAGATTEKAAGEIVVAGLEVTNSPYRPMNVPESLESGPWRILR
jgi:hypothetical protein